MMMEYKHWWHKLIVIPVKRAWLSLSSRLKPRPNGDGLLELHHDIQSCEYEDVQVMWEMLQRSEPVAQNVDHPAVSEQRPFWRVHIWSSCSSAASLAADPA